MNSILGYILQFYFITIMIYSHSEENKGSNEYGPSGIK